MDQFNGGNATVQVGLNFQWIVGASVRKDQSVRVSMALKAGDAAEALGTGWSINCPVGQGALFDVTYRAETGKDAANPVFFAAAGDRRGER